MNTEDNKLIAEFMGWKVDKSISSAHFKKTGGYHLTNGTRTMASDQLQYHTSWDWLMPVVDKIAKESMYYLTFDDDKGTNFQKLQLGLNGATTGNFDLVYKAVVEFIKWYNEQKH